MIKLAVEQHRVMLFEILFQNYPRRPYVKMKDGLIPGQLTDKSNLGLIQLN